MSEAMEEIQRLKEEVEELRDLLGRRELENENAEILLAKRVEEVDELTRETEDLHREKSEAQLLLGKTEEELRELRSAFETADKIPDNLRATLKGREEYIGRLETMLENLKEEDDRVRYVALLEERKVQLDKQLAKYKAANDEFAEVNATISRERHEARREVKRLEHLLAKREANVEALEHRVGTLEEIIRDLTERLDRGETFEDFERRVLELVNEGEPKRSLKRLASFMKYTLGLVRENRELAEKNIDLDAENEHLGKSIDAMNATLAEAGVERASQEVEDDSGDDEGDDPDSDVEEDAEASRGGSHGSD